MAKWLWLIAGPNGAGKSTYTTKLIIKLQTSGEIDTEIVKLNADERTAELQKQFPESPRLELNLQAARETDAALLKSIADGKPVIFIETVLSSPKYQDDILEAKARGYHIGLVYISVHPPELILGRIKDRVAEGGHNVEAHKALDRYQRSHAKVVWFAQQADSLLMYDNSSRKTGPVLVAVKEAGKKLTHKAKGLNPSLDHAIKALKKIRRLSPGRKAKK
jgi:predicted ABC-type ATPase